MDANGDGELSLQELIEGAEEAGLRGILAGCYGLEALTSRTSEVDRILGLGV